MNEPAHPAEPISEPMSTDEIRAACESPIQYIAVLHQYLDGGLSGLPPSSQRVLLQLVRETLARGRDQVRITIRTLVEKTGFSKDTIMKALRHLSSPDVDLINVVDPGGAHTPGHYQVRWFRYRKPLIGRQPQRSRLRIVSAVNDSIENRLTALTSEDREKVEKSYMALPAKDREALEASVTENLRYMGVVVKKETFHQLVLFETMRKTMYQHIKKHYPTMFSFNPVHKS